MIDIKVIKVDLTIINSNCSILEGSSVKDPDFYTINDLSRFCVT